MKIVCILTTCLIAVFAISADAQITGPTPTYAGSTQQYTWSGSSLSSPNWIIASGTKVSQNGNSVTVTWNTNATGGAIVLINAGVHKGTLSVTLTPAPAIPATPSILLATSITATSFTANWGSSPAASSYRLDVSTSSSFNTFVNGYNNLSVSGTSQVVSGLIGGGIFYYRVRAVSSSGTSPNSDPSQPVEVTLGSPANITVTPYSNSLDLSWVAVQGATGYVVEVDTDATFTAPIYYSNVVNNTTSKVVSGLNPSTTYWIRLRSFYGTTYSPYSATVQKNTLAPPQITGPNPTYAGSTQQYAWTGSPLSDPNWVFVRGTKTSQTGNSVTVSWDMDATSGVIVLVNAGIHLSTTNVGFLPIAPVLSLPTSITANSFIANWNSTPTATSYQLDVSTSTLFDSFVAGYDNLSVSGTSQAVSGLTGGGTFYYRVRALNIHGVSFSSEPSPAVEVSLRPPTNVSAIVHTHSLDVAWTAAPGAGSYLLDVATDAGFTNLVSGYNAVSVNGTNQVVNSLRPSTTYWIRIKSFDGSAYSPNSAALQKTTMDQFVTVNENYIVANELLAPNVTNSASIKTLPRENVSQSVQYFDGLGRPIQTVTTEGSPLKKDVVQPMAYDAYGRESVKYLPYVDVTESNGWYKPNALQDPTSTVTTELDKYRSGRQYAFYQIDGLIAQDQYPYSETKFEASPLSRVLKQGALGAGWQPDASNDDHTVKTLYDLNLENEVVKWFYIPPDLTHPNGIITPGQFQSPVYYAANKLYKNTIKDEHGNEVISYVDMQGKTILKKVQASATEWAQTYYIYDDNGLLVAVLQPQAVKILLEN